MTTDNYLGELFDFSESKPKMKRKSTRKKNVLADAFASQNAFSSLEKSESQSQECRKPMSVSALTRQIRRQIESNFTNVWVEGEISTFKDHNSGHYYFTLKDKNSQIPAVMFRGANSRLKFKPENGMMVVITGNVKIYEPQGKYQIVCEKMSPSGIGAMQIAFEQLKKKLSLEGLFDKSRKKELPAFPKIIGVVTSDSGAAFHDIKNVLFRRFPNCRLVLNPAPVQGLGAAGKIARAIDECNEAKKCGAVDFDVLIIGRGGGSMEDLWCFNEEIVARAIARSELPIISAVGHEIDWTIADFAADKRAPTPSAAAEIVVTPREEWLSQIIDLQRRLTANLDYILDDYRNRVVRAKTSYVFREPRRLIDMYRQRVDEFSNTLSYSFKEQVSGFRLRFSSSLNILYSAEKIFAVQLKQRRKNIEMQCRALENTKNSSIANSKNKLMHLLRQL
ncbi:MAG: exodeoxyribonuclease VII large subunit, partial [Chlamydiae bacterium]